MPNALRGQSVIGALRYTGARLLQRLSPVRSKKLFELRYWEARFKEEGPLTGGHMRHFFTDAFGLTIQDYAGKRLLDIGCGPRGSLEWAEQALERIGLDPLAKQYMKFGASKHRMKYVAAPSEHIPFDAGYFDYVSSFNSLDHVDDLSQTIREIKRVTKAGGHFLLIVEINHPPTLTEPITLGSNVLELFAPEFSVVKSWETGLPEGKHQVYGSVRKNLAVQPGKSAVLCAQLVRES